MLPKAGAVVDAAASQPGLPLGIAALVVLFLLVQNRIDRKDPKLAAGSGEVGDLGFGLPRSLPVTSRDAPRTAVPPRAATSYDVSRPAGAPPNDP